MILSPRKKMILTTKKGLDDFKVALKSLIDIRGVVYNQWFLNFRNDKDYIGSIQSNRFVIQPTVKYLNLPFLHVKGEILEDEKAKGLKIKLNLSLHILLLIMIILFSVVFYLLLSIQDNLSIISQSDSLIKDYPIILLFPSVLYSIAWYYYWKDAKKFIDRLKQKL